jgi:uncharacterized oxidoreductase
MKTTGNTILITGGGSGIGQGLAEAFHRLGNQVVISGRDRKKLDRVTSANRGMCSFVVDMVSPDSIRSFAAQLTAEFPALNAVIHNAGIMKGEDILNQKEPLSDMEATIATNLTGPIRLTAALLPLLRKQPRATLMTVSSGLAFLPLAMTPTYCATKAAIHSYTQSLRYQLRETSIQVIELIPPYVQTTLTGDHQAKDPAAMPLDEYIAETMEILTKDPTVTEILVKRVHPLRLSADNGRAKYEEMFKGFNDNVSKNRSVFAE